MYIPSTTIESSSSACCWPSSARVWVNTAVKHKQIPNRNNPMAIAKWFPAKNVLCHRGALGHAMLQFYKLALIKRVSCICPLHIPHKKISICENEIWPQIRQTEHSWDVNNPLWQNFEEHTSRLLLDASPSQQGGRCVHCVSLQLSTCFKLTTTAILSKKKPAFKWTCLRPPVFVQIDFMAPRRSQFWEDYRVIGGGFYFCVCRQQKS